MDTDKPDSWILVKPEGYLAIPARVFLTYIQHAKNLKYEWSSGGDKYSLSAQPMSMLFLSDEQMQTILVRSRITQASAPDPSGAG